MEQRITPVVTRALLLPFPFSKSLSRCSLAQKENYQQSLGPDAKGRRKDEWRVMRLDCHTHHALVNSLSNKSKTECLTHISLELSV